LARLQRLSQPFADVSWTETVTWTAPELSADAVAAPAAHKVQPQKRLAVSIKGPNWVRIETEEGRVRVAQGGRSLSIDSQGRFWVTPRQDLVSVLFTLPTLSAEAALRELAGDVPGSPFLRGGIAIDLITEVEDGHHRFYVIGTTHPGARVPQLWLDAETGYPTNLVERFPIIQTRGHEPQGFGGVVETKFYDFTLIQDAYWMPMRFERVLDGRWTQQVRVEQVRVNRGIAARRFDLTRLGGIRSQPSHDLIASAPAHAEAGEPGWAVPSLGHASLPHPLAPHPPYNSSPPTSGPYLPFAARWGTHAVPIPLALQVHNLARGGVAIQYNCPQTCPDLVAKLERIVKRYDHLLLAPYPLMDAPLALTAWGRMLTLHEFDEARIVGFVEAYVGQDHTLSGRQESH
jgi:hypothetical protein